MPGVKKQPRPHWQNLFLALTLGLVMTKMSGRAADETPRALKVVNARRTLIIGHRGYPAFAPENTIPSWKMALEAGADMAELDYYPPKTASLLSFTIRPSIAPRTPRIVGAAKNQCDEQDRRRIANP